MDKSPILTPKPVLWRPVVVVDDKDFESVGEPDSFIVTSSDHAIARSEHILGKSLHPKQRRSKKNP